MRLWIGWSISTFFSILIGWHLHIIWSKRKLRKMLKVHPNSILGKILKLQIELGIEVLDALTKEVK